jgi:TetR/AcrR family tetracycline transcriptional repressor
LFTILIGMGTPSTPDRAAVLTSSRGRPPRLDAGHTVEVALRLLNEVGLDALTMRRVADGVNAQVGALYRYFPTKQDLLAAMAERILSGCAEAPPEGDWLEQVTEMARRMRNALLGHRDGARVYAGTHSTGTNTLGFADTLIGVLRGAGFPDGDAARAALAVVFYTLGHTLEEQAAAEGAGEHLRHAIASAGFPHLAATETVLTSSDFATHFEFGLRLITRGLRGQGTEP